MTYISDVVSSRCNCTEFKYVATNVTVRDGNNFWRKDCKGSVKRDMDFEKKILWKVKSYKLMKYLIYTYTFYVPLVYILYTHIY